MPEARLVVCISGNGSNLQALIDACASGVLPAQIVLVVSNRQSAYGLTRAAAAGLPTLTFPLQAYTRAGRSRAAYDADLAGRLVPYAPDLIVLAGWMHIFSPAFLDVFPGRVINLHPALPGAFPGVQAIERTFAAYQAGAVEHGGCMVHVVVPEVDAGAPLIQAQVPIHPHDSLERFQARMHTIEHHLIIAGVHIALEGLAYPAAAPGSTLTSR